MTEPLTLSQLTQPTGRHGRRPRRVLRALAAGAFLLVTLSGTALGAHAYATAPERVAMAIQQAPMSGLIPACQEAVKRYLKSPGSAKFGGESVTARDPYVVTGWVDSQNGFGALVRNRYYCRAWRGETWRAEDPSFSDW